MAPPVQAMWSLRNIVRALVTGAFVITLMQYWVTIPHAEIVPIILLYLAGAVVLLANDRAEKISRLFNGGGVLFIFLLLSEVITLVNGEAYSTTFGLVLLGLMLTARLIIMSIGLLRIVQCYIASAIFCTIVILIAGKKQLHDYHGGDTRFTGGTDVHPNLVSFTLASYFPLFVGLALDLPPGKRRWIMGSFAFISLALLFTTGSRGSVGAIVAALIIISLRYTLVDRHPLQYLRLSLAGIASACLGVSAVIYILARGNTLAKLSSFIVNAMSLNSSQRGLHSGFSGRTFLWLRAIHNMHGLDWVVGKGYRQPYIFDSGYITILFENGLLGGLVILGCMLRAVYWLTGSTRRSEMPGWWRYHVVLWSLLIIYLINNITTRYLFSYGNQFSLLVIFMIMCSRRELLGRAIEPRGAKLPNPLNQSPWRKRLSALRIS